MASNKYAYLGSAVRYPIAIQSGRVQIAEGKTVIEGSLIMILTTPLGSREALPDYGSRLDELLWEPNDRILETLLKTYIADAIGKWERRIKLVAVQIVTQDDMSLCSINYKILPSNEVDAFVFPFYRKSLPY